MDGLAIHNTGRWAYFDSEVLLLLGNTPADGPSPLHVLSIV